MFDQPEIETPVGWKPKIFVGQLCVDRFTAAPMSPLETSLVFFYKKKEKNTLGLFLELLWLEFYRLKDYSEYKYLEKYDKENIISE